MDQEGNQQELHISIYQLLTCKTWQIWPVWKPLREGHQQKAEAAAIRAGRNKNIQKQEVQWRLYVKKGSTEEHHVLT